MVVAGEPEPELGRGRRLPGTLKARQEKDRRRLLGELELAPALSPEQRDQLVAHDPDDLLGRGQGLEDFLAQRALLHPIDELPGDVEVNVGVEQGVPNLARRLVDVALRHPPAAPEVPEDLLESV